MALAYGHATICMYWHGTKLRCPVGRQLRKDQEPSGRSQQWQTRGMPGYDNNGILLKPILCSQQLQSQARQGHDAFALSLPLAFSPPLGLPTHPIAPMNSRRWDPHYGHANLQKPASSGVCLNPLTCVSKWNAVANQTAPSEHTSALPPAPATSTTAAATVKLIGPCKQQALSALTGVGTLVESTASISCGVGC